MTTDSFEVFALQPFPTVMPGDSLAEAIATAAGPADLRDGDIIVVASKVVSIEEHRRVELADVEPTNAAQELAAQTGKDPRVVELILQESVSHRVAEPCGPIIAKHRLGYELTSAGVDRDGPDAAYLLPADPDRSARRVRDELASRTGAQIAVIVADSDGRPDRRGATVIAIGAAGLTPLRVTTVVDGCGTKQQEETIVDLVAAAAGIVIGQRGRGAPIAVLRGVQFEQGNEGVRATLHSHVNAVADELAAGRST